MGNKKHATWIATLLQNELNSDVARLTTNVRTCLAKNNIASFFSWVVERATSPSYSFCRKNVPKLVAQLFEPGNPFTRNR